MQDIPSIRIPRRFLLHWALLAPLVPLAPRSAHASAPALMLANTYRHGVPLADYWVSEKYDGVRGFWNGHRLLTRGGEPVTPPGWFTEGWPEEPLDGELWAGYGAFSRAVSTVRQQSASEAAWHGMAFMVFDLPAQAGTFDERLPLLHRLVVQLQRPWVRAVAQDHVANPQALMARLRETVRQGGEGLVLHRGASAYQGVRSDDLLKLKPFEDAEARVVAHVQGHGRYAGLMGALLVQTPAGLRFRIGSGFSAAQRRDPPPIGTWVTYRFQGLNPSGVPRFATFMRPSEDLRA